MNVQSFYEDPEIETIKKLLLDLEIKLNIFDHKKMHRLVFGSCYLILCYVMRPALSSALLFTFKRGGVLCASSIQ